MTMLDQERAFVDDPIDVIEEQQPTVEPRNDLYHWDLVIAGAGLFVAFPLAVGPIGGALYDRFHPSDKNKVDTSWNVRALGLDGLAVAAAGTKAAVRHVRNRPTPTTISLPAPRQATLVLVPEAEL